MFIKERRDAHSRSTSLSTDNARELSGDDGCDSGDQSARPDSPLLPPPVVWPVSQRTYKPIAQPPVFYIYDLYIGPDCPRQKRRSFKRVDSTRSSIIIDSPCSEITRGPRPVRNISRGTHQSSRCSKTKEVLPAQILVHPRQSCASMRDAVQCTGAPARNDEVARPGSAASNCTTIFSTTETTLTAMEMVDSVVAPPLPPPPPLPKVLFQVGSPGVHSRDDVSARAPAAYPANFLDFDDDDDDADEQDDTKPLKVERVLRHMRSTRSLFSRGNSTLR